MHHVLERQIKRYLGQRVSPSSEWKAFFESISRTYTDFDEDRALLDRSLDISSQEFAENNRLLEKAKIKTEKQAQDLALQVANRTKELNDRVVELERVRSAMSNLLEDFEEEQKKREVLTKDLEKFKLAVDNASDNIIITDPEGMVIYANKSIETITGYTVEEAIGKKSGALWKMPMAPEYYQKFWNTIKKQKRPFTDEIQNRKKNGEVYTAEINVYPLLDKSREIMFFVGIERDITKEKEVEKAKTEFLSIASHALRTPLTAIDGLISMVLDGEYGKVNKNLTRPLKDVSTSSERLIHLVNDLLNLSRIQAGRMAYKLSDFRITAPITMAVRLLQPLSEQKGLQLTITKHEPILIQGDPDKILQILNNLIGNALKFTSRGSIRISTKAVDDTVEVHVTDTGTGIKKEDQKKLFGLFQQLNQNQAGPIGTGLGLHISREMARAMGGDIWVECSVPGKGSTFVFSVPKSNSARAKKTKEKVKKGTK